MKRWILNLACFGLLAVAASCVRAEVGAGFDLYHVKSLTVDLGPGVGRRSFEGAPIMDSLGDADLIVQRLPEGEGRRLRIIALSLKSKQPLFFGGKMVDVYITINNSDGVIATATLPEPDFILNSDGAVIGRPQEGYRLRIEVHADVLLVKAGAARPLKELEAHKAMEPFVLAASASWSRTVPRHYPALGAFPAGGRYPGKLSALGMFLVPASRP